MAGCDHGRVGPLCASCIDDHYMVRNNPGGECQPCTGAGSNAPRTCILLFWMACSVAVVSVIVATLVFYKTERDFPGGIGATLTAASAGTVDGTSGSLKQPFLNDGSELQLRTTAQMFTTAQQHTGDAFERFQSSMQLQEADQQQEEDQRQQHCGQWLLWVSPHLTTSPLSSLIYLTPLCLPVRLSVL